MTIACVAIHDSTNSCESTFSDRTGANGTYVPRFTQLNITTKSEMPTFFAN